MSSVGVFRKEEIDGKPSLVFTLTQIDHPTSSGEALVKDSGGNDLPLQPLFFCPTARIKFHELKLEMLDVVDDDDDDDGGDGDGDGDGDDDDDDDDDEDEDYYKPSNKLYPFEDRYKPSNKLHPFNSSPHFPSTRIGDQQGESLLDCDHNGVCKFPVVPLFWCNNKESHSEEFKCGGCETKMLSTSYYACLQCQRKFHKECVESPLEIKHPSHPFHSLRLSSDARYVTCTCCKELIYNMIYRCTATCKLELHPVCAMRPIPFVIDHPKSHPHPLTYFPTQTSTVCHFCAQIKKLDPTYICIQCVFVIHEDCIGFPHVIRISRHNHRVSFLSSLPTKKLSCGVCHQQVDNKYGAYSCLKCDAYFVHSKCALHPKVWDGKELEGIPEEDDKIDDGEPFERIADGLILHPFHCHRLRLEIFRAYDENKFCQGCALPIYEGQFYSCMECNFILHESCASAPLMKRHPLHPHPLTLTFAIKTTTLVHMEGTLYCYACNRFGTGFFYEHHIGDERFALDIRCASILEPFKYEGHKHPLFLPWDPPRYTRCKLCKYQSEDPKLICLKCDYTICFSCATLPYKVRYKHDSHFLMICDEKEASDQPDWCEICEGKIKEVEERDLLWLEREKERRLYKCNECCTTLHVKCLLGLDMYMKPGNTKEDDITVLSQDWEWTGVRILLNNSLSRPICTGCMRRCPFPIYFKGPRTILCSARCVG